MTDHVAVAETEIDASPDDIWNALTDPEAIEKYMFGSHVESSWEEGGHIVWKGEYEGREYADHGKILEIERPRRLRFTHFSPLSGKQDLPENYHTILYELEGTDDSTRITLSQDNNDSAEDAEHSQANWQQVLAGLKQVVEGD
jgi:uncharacterized protein YndB with AHSA1/START domain